MQVTNFSGSIQNQGQKHKKCHDKECKEKIKPEKIKHEKIKPEKQKTKLYEEKPDGFVSSTKVAGKAVKNEKEGNSLGKLALIGTGLATAATSLYLLAHPEKAPKLIQDLAGKAPDMIKNAFAKVGSLALSVEDSVKLFINNNIKDEWAKLPLSNKWHNAEFNKNIAEATANYTDEAITTANKALEKEGLLLDLWK